MYSVYLIFTFLLAILLSRKTDKKLLSFLISFYILAQPVLTIEYTVNLPILPFDLQPNRILLFILPIFLLTDMISKKNVQYQDNPFFEKCLLLCLISVGIALIWNHRSIPTKEFIIIPSQILLFVFIYFVLKKQATEKLNETIIKAIIFVAFISSIIAIIQLFFDYSFMKTHGVRGALPGVVRSTGIFFGEYDLGFIINFAFILSIVRYHKKYVYLYVILPVLFLGLFSTFHRLSWIIFILFFITYLFLFRKSKLTIASITGLIMVSGVILMLFFSNPNILKKVENEPIVHDRLLKSISGRLSQYVLIANTIIKYPIGLGGYDNKIYSNIMEKENLHTSSHKIPWVIHNGYLAFGLLYGVLGLFSFLGLIISMLVYFYKNYSVKRPDTAYPFFIVLLWALSNVSNSVSSLNTYIVIIVAIVCGSYMSILGKKKETY